MLMKLLAGWTLEMELSFCHWNPERISIIFFPLFALPSAIKTNPFVFQISFLKLKYCFLTLSWQDYTLVIADMFPGQNVMV